MKGSRYRYSTWLVLHWKKKIIHDLLLYQSKQPRFPESGSCSWTCKGKSQAMAADVVTVVIFKPAVPSSSISHHQAGVCLFLNSCFVSVCLYTCSCVSEHSMHLEARHWCWVYSSVTSPLSLNCELTKSARLAGQQGPLDSTSPLLRWQCTQWCFASRWVLVIKLRCKHILPINLPLQHQACSFSN